MQQNKKVLSGNRIIISIDGKAVGLAQSAEFHDDYAPDAASGIGSIDPTEYVPTMGRYSVSIEQMAMDGNSLRELGVFPESSSDVMKGLVFDVLSCDKDSGAVVRKATGCSYASGSVSIRKHAIVMSSGTLNALGMSGTGA